MPDDETIQHEPKAQWTDDEKRALFAAFDAAKAAGQKTRDWLAERKISSPHFYRMRKLFELAQQPPATKKYNISKAGLERIRAAQKRRWKEAKANGTGKYTKTKGQSFRAADEDTKRQMIAEFDALPKIQKAAWRKAHGLGAGSDTGALSYWRKRLNVTSTALVPYTSNGNAKKAITPAMLAEYETAPSKAKWLQARGMNYSNIHDARKRLAQQPQQSPIATATQLPPHILPTAAPGPVVTLDDAIAAMQVRQDLFTEFLEQLKRMQRVGR